MYNYIWDKETGGYLLDTKITGVIKEVRPVFKEELRLIGFDKEFNWIIPETDLPIMWAEGRRYIYFGECIGEAVGGGLYSSPTLKSTVSNIQLKPVDVKEMVDKNRVLMTGLEQKTLRFIYKTYKEHLKKVDISYVAFSGGKDSIVMLDLVQRALPHDRFEVIFADTTMELDDTYKAVDLAMKRWPDLNWNIAKSHLPSPKSWQLIGPPAEKMRWCCSVHKTAPQVLLIKSIVGKDQFKTLVYVGVRAEESDTRSTYESISESKKHIMQTSCIPLLEWNTCELFLYMMQNNLLINAAYKKGLTRAGCVFCPMSSKWSFLINGRTEHSHTEKYVDIITQMLSLQEKSQQERKKYFDERNWKLRLNGRDLSIGENRLIEVISDEYVEFLLVNSSKSYFQWLSTLGNICFIDENTIQIEYKDLQVNINVIFNNNAVKMRMRLLPKNVTTIRFMHLLRNALSKSVYCIGCKVCLVECPVGAINMNSQGETTIKGCVHCENCLDKPKGCLVAQSLSLPIGGSCMKNLAAYQKRGFRQDWLEMFFKLSTDFWGNKRMGKNMFMAFKAWMKDADLLNGGSPTKICTKLQQLGSDSLLTWAVIFNNLSYNSSIINWFVNQLQFNVLYDNNALRIELGDSYTISVKDSALRSLKETLKSSPIGWGLGIGDCEMKGNSVVSITKRTWNNPEPLAILYSLYKYAEKSDNFYSFTLSDLFDEDSQRVGISPIKLYNLERETCKQIIESLARDYSSFIQVNFNKDMMEDIYLHSDKTSLDVVNIF